VQNWKSNSTTAGTNNWKTYGVMWISIFAIMIKRDMDGQVTATKFPMFYTCQGRI
jgi:hypothetical protein